jgi:hypothetical protein
LLHSFLGIFDLKYAALWGAEKEGLISKALAGYDGG